LKIVAPDRRRRVHIVMEIVDRRAPPQSGFPFGMFSL
jgi:hypothetical protein